jgi:hypothetical protein
MTRIERMKGQRQQHVFGAWRERLCAEKPTKAVAVAVAYPVASVASVDSVASVHFSVFSRRPFIRRSA